MNITDHTSTAGPLLSLRRAAEFLDVHPSTLRRLIAGGEIPTVQVAGRRLVARPDLDAFIDSHREARP